MADIVSPTHAIQTPPAKYVFAGHAEHVRFCKGTQLDAPANEYKPVAQFEQVLTLRAPTTLDDVPAGHRMQALTVMFAYAPAGQPMHTLAPTPENVPTGQLVHAAVVVSLLYCPAGHAVQGPPGGPVYPALHLQSEIDFDDAENGDCELAGHDTQFIAALVMIMSEMYV